MGQKRGKNISEHRKDSLRTMQDTLKDWTKPKSDENAAFTHLRALNQGNKTLSAYIQEVRRVVDLCNFTCVGDCKDRLIRNFIVPGLSSTKAYQQCILKGSSLSLSECIRICQTEDATYKQVQDLCPESTDCGDSALIQKFTPVSPAARQAKLQGQRSLQGQQTQPQGWPSCRDLVLEKRLQTQY